MLYYFFFKYSYFMQKTIIKWYIRENDMIEHWMVYVSEFVEMNIYLVKENRIQNEDKFDTNQGFK